MLKDEVAQTIISVLKKNGISCKFHDYNRPTESLFRYGFYEIYGYMYSVTTLNLRDKKITLKDEEETLNIIKINFQNETVSGRLPKKPLIEKIKKWIIKKLS